MGSRQSKRPVISRKRGLNLDIRRRGDRLPSLVFEEDNATDGAIGLMRSSSTIPQVRFGDGNIQVNDSTLDTVQFLPGFRPILGTVQTHPSIAAHNQNIVAGYLSFANAPVSIISGNIVRDHVFGAAFSTSTDGGMSWASGFLPTIPGYLSVGNVANMTVDHHGIFYCQAIGRQHTTGDILPGTFFPQLAIQLNKSTDGGLSWSDGILVDQDEGDDHANIAVGRDPVNRNRDNVYVTWLSFHGISDGDPVRLRLARSTDGGTTWTTKTIAEDTPDTNPTMPQFVGDSVLYVDAITGRLYVTYQYLSDSDVDFIRLLVSDDAGETFSPVTFNLPGARFPDLVSFVQPGEIIDCGSPGGGVRLTIHSGPDIGGGRFGLARYVNASRINTAPTFAARDGVMYLAYSTSTSPFVGIPGSNSIVVLLKITDSGATWASVQVNPDSPTDTQHVLPSLAIDNDPNDVHIVYYTQHSDGTVDLDIANSHDRGDSFPADRNIRITGTPFMLAPTNIPVPTPTRPFATTHHDFFAQPCTNLGSLAHSPNTTFANGKVYVVWADSRKTISEPVNSLNPLSGQTHPQLDIFFQDVKAQ
jgi:hypothetical protein